MTRDLVAGFEATGSAGPTRRIGADDAGHLLWGWSAPSTLPDGRRVVFKEGNESAFWFDAGDAPVDRTLRLVASLDQAGEGVPIIFVRINGRPLGRLRRESGSEELTLRLPSAQQRPGRNQLVILGPAFARAVGGARPTARLGLVTLHLDGAPNGRVLPSRRDDGIVLPPGTIVTYRVRLPPDARLQATRTDERTTRLRLMIDRDGHPSRSVALEGATSIVDLGDESRAIVQLRLEAVAAPDASSSAPVVLARAVIEGTAPAPPRAAATAALAPRPNVVLYVTDTTRADRLGFHGYAKPTTPELDRFAQDSVVFERATAQGSWTRPSVASIFTGRHPFEHGARTLMDRVRPELPTLATVLREHGWVTGAVVTNLNVSAPFGFDRGFEAYRYLPEGEQRRAVFASAAEANAEAFQWLDERAGDAPFFLYLHVSDAHAPYRPPPASVGAFMPSGIHPTFTTETPMRELRDDPALATPDNVALLSALYDADLPSVDAGFAALLEHLRQRDLLDRTLIVFVADHGEEFHEHGGFEHGRTLYEEIVHVPLVIRLPGGVGGGCRVTTRAQQIDILPTILDLVGVAAPADLPGRVLVRRDGTEGAERESVLSESSLYGPDQVAVWSGEWKGLWAAGRNGETLLFALDADPGERRDVARENPIVVAYLRQQANELMGRMVSRRVSAEEPVTDPEIQNRLRALGYLND